MELVHTSTELNKALTKAKFYNGNNNTSKYYLSFISYCWNNNLDFKNMISLCTKRKDISQLVLANVNIAKKKLRLILFTYLFRIVQ